MPGYDTDYLDKLGEKIRELWCEERKFFDLRNTGISSNWGSLTIRRWDGGKTVSGRFYKPVWPIIAKFCLDHDLEPEQLIKAMFYKTVLTAPLPNMAHGNYALDKYRQYTLPTTNLEIKTKAITEFETQKSRAYSTVNSLVKYNGVDEQTAWKMVIADSKLPLTPLFRYCISKNQDWPILYEKYKDPAIRQYKRNSEIYNEVWKEWIPMDLRSIKEKKNERK